MSITRDPKVDRNLESHQEDLLPIDVSYTKYQYEKVTPQSDVTSWNGGSNLVFNAGEYTDSVWDLGESYVELEAALQLNYTSTLHANTDVPLSAFSNACLEKFFFSSLLEDVQVQYGNTPVKQIQCPPQLYPLLHSVYTACSSRTAERFGAARSENWLKVDSTLAGADVEAQAKIDLNRIPQNRKFSILRDAEWPYNECLSGDSNDQTFIPTTYGIPVDAYDSLGFFPPVWNGPGWQYRSSLILPTQNSTYTGSAGAGNGNYQDGYTKMVMKLKVPLADIDKKLPANIPLRFTFRRSRNIGYSVQGLTVSDALFSSGADVVLKSQILDSKYVLKIRNMDLYLKRLTLSADQRMVLYESPSMIYDVPAWSAQQYDLTSNVFTKNVTFESLPSVVLIGLVPKNSISPPSGSTHFSKLTSVFDTTPPNVLTFSSLQLNTSYGRVPEDPYQPADSNGQLFSAQAMRAYKEFLKALKTEDKAPIPFKTWLNTMQWYAFVLNTNGQNPNYIASRPERSTIQVNANLVGQSGELDANSVVVIGMELNEMVITGMRNVSLVV